MSNDLDYQDILNGAADMIVQLDHEGHILFANSSFCLAFGCSDSELRGQRLVADILGDAELEQEIIDRFSHRSASFVIREFKVVTTTGSRWLQWIFSRCKNQSESHLLIASGRDVTENQWQISNLKAEYKGVRSLLDHAPFAMICLNREKIIVECNRQIETMLLYPREDVLGSHLSRILHKDYHRLVDSSLRELIVSGKSCTTRCQVVRRDGVIMASRLTMVPQLDENGNFTQTICFMESLADLRQTYAPDESEAIRRREELNNKDIALKELLFQLNDQQVEVQKRIHMNVNRLILPMIHQLEDTLSDDNHQRIVALKNRLLDITTPFTSQLETEFDSLTPRETQVCNLICDGLSSKQIAGSLDVSVHTVHNQRRSIRRKLGIAEQNTNMITHLKNLKRRSRPSTAGSRG